MRRKEYSKAYVEIGQAAKLSKKPKKGEPVSYRPMARNTPIFTAKWSRSGGGFVSMFSHWDKEFEAWVDVLPFKSCRHLVKSKKRGAVDGFEATPGPRICKKQLDVGCSCQRLVAEADAHRRHAENLKKKRR